MTWFDETSVPAPADGAPPPAGPGAGRRRRTGLVAALVACGVLLGLVVAGGVWAVGRYLDGAGAVGPSAPDVPRATAAPARAGCGDALPPPSLSPERTLDLQVEARAGVGQFDVLVALVNVGEDVVVRAASDVAVVAVAGDSVVGEVVTAELRHEDERRADPYLLDLGTGLGRTVEVTYPLVACDGGPLPAGEYTVHAGVVLSEADGSSPRDLAGVSAPVPVD